MSEKMKRLDLESLPIPIRVELGRSTITLAEAERLASGDVIELSKCAGDLLDIYANDRLIAQGETVLVNEKFGIKILRIIAQAGEG